MPLLLYLICSISSAAALSAAAFSAPQLPPAWLGSLLRAVHACLSTLLALTKCHQRAAPTWRVSFRGFQRRKQMFLRQSLPHPGNFDFRSSKAKPKARSLRAWVPISTLQPPLRCGKLAPTLRWLHRRTSNLRERGGGSSWCMHSASIDSAASVSANPSDGFFSFFMVQIKEVFKNLTAIICRFFFVAAGQFRSRRFVGLQPYFAINCSYGPFQYTCSACLHRDSGSGSSLYWCLDAAPDCHAAAAKQAIPRA